MDWQQKVAAAVGLPISVIMQLSALNCDSIEEARAQAEQGRDLAQAVVRTIRRDAEDQGLA